MHADLTTESDGLADTDLVRQAQEGNTEALDCLLRRHCKVLLGLARRRCGNCAWVEDLCQEVSVRVMSHLRDLREPKAFPCWMRALLENAARNCRRKNCKKSGTLTAQTDPGTIESPNVGPALGGDMEWLWSLVCQQARKGDGDSGRVAAFMLEHYAQHDLFPSIRVIARAMQASNRAARRGRATTLLRWRRVLRAFGFAP